MRIPGEDYRQAEVEVGELVVDRQASIKGTNCQYGVGSTEQAGLHNMRWLDEELVPDVRSRLTPAEMVDQKLDAMVGSNYRGIRRMPTSER
jgi:hypothetical protein